MTDPERFLRAIARLHEPTGARGNRQGGFKVGRRRSGKVLRPQPAASGHLYVMLREDGVRKQISVHRLVLEAFVSRRPAGMQGCHANDDPADNRLSNLRWDTRSANTLDSVRNGKHACARKTHCPAGHPYTPDNTYIQRAGGRVCRQCKRARPRKVRQLPTKATQC